MRAPFLNQITEMLLEPSVSEISQLISYGYIVMACININSNANTGHDVVVVQHGKDSQGVESFLYFDNNHVPPFSQHSVEAFDKMLYKDEGIIGIIKR